MGFFAELRRRHVLRAAALYGAVAWLLIQVTDVVSEPLGLPGSLLKVVIWLLVIGFPVMLAIAWSFELTRHGLKRDTGAETSSVAGVSAGRNHRGAGRRARLFRCHASGGRPRGRGATCIGSPTNPCGAALRQPDLEC